MSYRVIGVSEKLFSYNDVNAVRELTPHIHKKVLVTDYLDQDEQELKDILTKYNIAILVKLTNNVNKSVGAIGYLLLGPKKSGNQYSSLDIQVLNTVSKELVIAIQNSLRYEEIEQFNVTLQNKVDEATSKLRHTNEQLKALDEAKDDFISMASHQLRTPLTSVKGYISMILDERHGKDNCPSKEDAWSSLLLIPKNGLFNIRPSECIKIKNR